MPTPYSGHVVFEGDENHRWVVNIDDLDRADWVANHPAPSPGGWLPVDGDTVRVTLADGPRVTEQATAVFRGKVDPWLRGMGPFEPV